MITLLKLTKKMNPSESLHITGLEESAISYSILRILLNSNLKNGLIICPDDESCALHFENFKNFLTIEGHPELISFVHLFPTLGAEPTSSIHASLKNIYKRMSILGELLEPKHPKIIFTTLNASLQKGPSLNTIRSYTSVIKKSSQLGSREDFIKKCTDAGYLRVDTVIDPGTFSIRGEIIDIFSPQSPYPIRIECFDTEIEKIRNFNPETQMTLEEDKEEAVFGDNVSKEYIILPSRESFIPQSLLKNVRTKLKKIGDEYSIHRSIRDPLLENIQSGTQLEYSHYWAPLIFDESESLVELFSCDSLFYINEYSVNEKWTSYENNFNQNYLESLNAGRFLPSFKSLYTESKILKNKKCLQLYFDKITLSEDIKLNQSLKMNCHSNSVLKSFLNHSDDLFQYLNKKLSSSTKLIFCCSTESQSLRIKHLLKERQIEIECISFFILNLSSGFEMSDEKIFFINDYEFFGSEKKIKKNSSKENQKEWVDVKNLSHLKDGDYIIHRDHGIGKYLGFNQLTINHIKNEFLTLEYAGSDKLYLPVYRVNIIQKYSDSESGGNSVELDRLGSKNFEEKKKKVSESVKKLAIDLVKLYAERQLKRGPIFTSDEQDFINFEQQFPFEETPDQLKAIAQINDDFLSGAVMDRLVCGDVGFGKTEIAIRAAFKAVSSGYQVAVLVPTTILCYQHENSFKQRMKNYPINIESISRFKTTKEQKETLENLKQGKIDILIGTHRLLSKDIQFQKLGLLIIDEEHRFGVEHKEKLKQLKINTHVLTMTATPIPRTLHMALSGMREISLISTPPVDRLPIQTLISKFEDSIIKKGIEFELSRDGQVFFVHNNIETIYTIAEKISKLVPHAMVDVGHARMSENELENVITRFYQKKSNVLVSTTIIESGIDIPNANTIFINNADHFGLSQLYQIRGRVGRSQNRAYAYLLINKHKEISELATNRLQIIQKFVELGSGFSIASHDLELRGGGNIIGAEQSGHIHTVGYEMYLDLLQKEISILKGKKEDTSLEPEIKIPFSAYISENYIKDSHQSLNIYRRLSSSLNDEELNLLEKEIQNRFGKCPDETIHLFWLIRIKIILKNYKLVALTLTEDRMVLTPGEGCLLNPKKAIELISKFPKKYQFTSDSKFIVNVKILSINELFFTLEKCLNELQ